VSERLTAALDQAIAASGEVRTASFEVPVSSTGSAPPPVPSNYEEWPVTGVQIPWKEWSALVDAIREAAA
jgi:hypothetical protein